MAKRRNRRPHAVELQNLNGLGFPLTSGLVLVYKRLESSCFSWPRVQEGVARISRAQFEALFDGLQWQRLDARQVVQPGAAA